MTGAGAEPTPRGVPGVRAPAPSHLLHEDLVALVDAALAQLPVSEPEWAAALGGSAGPGDSGAGERELSVSRPPRDPEPPGLTVPPAPPPGPATT